MRCDDTEFAAKLAEGREVEDRILPWLARRGLHVVPMGAMNTSGAPSVLTPGGPVVPPDVIAIRPRDAGGTSVIGVEVKAKAGPSFRYSGPFRGWWHGVDLRLFRDHYRKLAASWDAFGFTVCETMTLPHDGFEPPRPVGGETLEDACKRALVPGPVWRWISYRRAEERGRESPRHFSGKDAWVWRVEDMQRIDVEEPCN